MGQPAARATDLAGHGGMIILGEPTVLIGGMPAARKGDPFLCPMVTGVVPHVGGVITMGSFTVLIGGMPAARMGDLTGCNIIGLAGRAIPLIMGPAAPPPAPVQRVSTDGKFHEDNDKTAPAGVTAVHAEAQMTDSDKDGSYDSVAASTEAVRMRNSAYGNLGPIEGGVTHNMDVFYGNTQATGRVGTLDNPGGSVSGSAETGMMKWGVGTSVGPADSQGRNPYAAVGAEANMFHAKAEGDLLSGHDGNRTGYVIKGEAGAEVLQGELTGTATTPSIFGVNIQGRGKVGASAGSAAIGGGAWLYYDHAEGRLHVGVSAKIAVLLGLKGDVELSAGREFRAPDAPPFPQPPTIDFMTIPGFGAGGIPGAVMTGFPTVLIG